MLNSARRRRSEPARRMSASERTRNTAAPSRWVTALNGSYSPGRWRSGDSLPAVDPLGTALSAARFHTTPAISHDFTQCACRILDACAPPCVYTTRWAQARALADGSSSDQLVGDGTGAEQAGFVG